VAPQILSSANALMMGVRQVTMLAGPLLAGLLFMLAGDGSAGMQDARGLGLAFAADCLSFALSAWTLSRVKPLATNAARKDAEPVLRAVGAGLATVWRDLTLRSAFLYWGLCACVVGGVMQVALPLLASERLHGASGLALMMGAHGTGALAGMALSGALGRRRVVNLGVTLLLVDGLVGLLLMPLGFVSQSWQAVLLLVAIGVLGGFVQVAVFTWIQQSVPQAMLGRMLGIFMFVFMGLAPLAAAAAGWLATLLSLQALFAAAGLFLTAAALLAWLFTPMSSLADAALPQARDPAPGPDGLG
jgi:MFS family permease